MRQWYQRKVRPNHGCEIPQHIVCVDTETRRETDPKDKSKSVHRFRLGVAQAWKWKRDKWGAVEEFRFLHLEHFWDWLEGLQHAKQPVTVWAHNLGFDLTVLDFWKQLEAGRFLLFGPKPEGLSPAGNPKRGFAGCMVLESRVCFLKLQGRVGKVNFSDLFNYYPMSLAKVGAGIGIEKSKVEFDGATDPELMEYCARDTSILSEAVKGLLAEWKRANSGVWQPTIAKLAYTNWRHTYVKRQDQKGAKAVEGPASSDEAQWEREALYGGWTEPFFYGVITPKLPTPGGYDGGGYSHPRPHAYGPIWELDFQSFYPSVMRDNLFPAKCTGQCGGWPPSKLRVAMGCCQAIAEVQIDSPRDVYPVRRDGHTFHCRGRFVTTLAGAELLAALNAGHVTAVLRGQTYRAEPLFRDWVDHWWTERQRAAAAGAGARALFVKVLMNSLFGKFSQCGWKWIDLPNAPALKTWGTWKSRNDETGEMEGYRAIAGNVQVRRRGEEPAHTFPAISACITAAGRVKLRRALALCPPQSVLYVSTDALYVLDPAMNALREAGYVAEGELGKLRIVDCHPDGEISGINDLRLGSKLVKAGVPLKGRLQAAGDWQGTVFENLPSILARVPDGTVATWERKFETPFHVWKNRMRPDGWAEPWTLGAAPGADPRQEPLYDFEADASRL